MILNHDSDLFLEDRGVTQCGVTPRYAEDVEYETPRHAGTGNAELLSTIGPRSQSLYVNTITPRASSLKFFASRVMYAATPRDQGCLSEGMGVPGGPLSTYR